MTNAKRYVGKYVLPSGQEAVGELTLAGSKTLLALHSDVFLCAIEPGACLNGTSYNGDIISLIDCLSPGIGSTSYKDGTTKYHSNVFPHFVTVGRIHLRPGVANIAGVHFTTTDLAVLFYDFNAFGRVIDTKAIIDIVLSEKRVRRNIDAGCCPQVLYFTGKTCITEVQTDIGKISVNHCPSSNMGGPGGVYIKNRIVVSIEPDSPVMFDEAINKMYEICSFLSFLAGRAQGINHIHVTTTDTDNGVPHMVRVHQSHKWKCSGGEESKPHPADIPLDPIQRKDEFNNVLLNWISRNQDWRLARGRYLGCLRKNNKYTTDRLVGAANMFDILPMTAFSINPPLEEQLAKTRDACVVMFQKLPQGFDRDSALSTLGRLGQPSLPKKVAHRVAIVESKFGETFPDLQFVTKTAIQCRNFYVHGSKGRIDFQKIEPFMHFLTDSLEFVSAASDLIEAGWDPAPWNAEPKGWGHNFARFRAEYKLALRALQQAINP
ncbi:MAG: hypothetical protein LWW87_11465 [Geobacteraceae bacterium]|nr:hypothetical protein [Geobacteraceae bacterium]